MTLIPEGQPVTADPGVLTLVEQKTKQYNTTSQTSATDHMLDPTGISVNIPADGDTYVVNGRWVFQFNYNGSLTVRYITVEWYLTAPSSVKLLEAVDNMQNLASFDYASNSPSRWYAPATTGTHTFNLNYRAERSNINVAEAEFTILVYRVNDPSKFSLTSGNTMNAA